MKAAKNRRRLVVTDKELEERFLEGLELPDPEIEGNVPEFEIPERARDDTPFFMG